MTIRIGEVLNFKCPYHAKVMKIFEMARSKIGTIYLIITVKLYNKEKSLDF